jgi:hypothetical protein
MAAVHALAKSEGRPTAGNTCPVQSGARRHGVAGIYGNVGIVESVTYRI